jgi:hypothetical protein
MTNTEGISTERRTLEERAVEFVRILAHGGKLLAHPDTIASWRNGGEVPWVIKEIIKAIGGPIDVMSSQYVKPDMFFAVPKPTPLPGLNWAKLDLGTVRVWSDQDR